MKKTISMLLAFVMLLSVIMVPGVFAFSASAEEAAGPVVLKFHYERPDGNYEGWDLFSWGAITGSAAFEEENGEMVATIYANDNEKLTQASMRLQNAYSYSDIPVKSTSIIKGIVE